MLVVFDDKKFKVRLTNRAHDVLKQLQQEESIARNSKYVPDNGEDEGVGDRRE
jgi:hypothetical protein